MSLPAPTILLAALFVMVFWMVGAYNRLVALRNGIGQAWAKVDEALRQRTAAATPLLAALREPMTAEAGALDAAQAALAEAARAATQMGHKPVVEAHASGWLAAEAGLAASASRLFALLEQQTELRLRQDVAANAREWRDADARLAFARQLFNEAAQAYNEAIALFPTRMLIPMFRFGRAGRL
jgi:LemA protein